MWSGLIGVLQFKHYLFTLCKYLDINIFLCLCNVVQHIYFQIILPFFYKILFENVHSFDASVLYDNVKTLQDHNLDYFLWTNRLLQIIWFSLKTHQRIGPKENRCMSRLYPYIYRIALATSHFSAFSASCCWV